MHCCPLGAIPDEEPSRVVLETDNFFVAPTIGPIGIEGYLLIISKDHCRGMGDIDPSDQQELEEVLHQTKQVVAENYGTPFVFEHGPRIGQYRGGGCLDHAHLHVVPGARVMDRLAVDLLKRVQDVGQFYRMDRTEGFERTSEIFHRGSSSYLFLEAPDNRRLITEVNFHLPSQYLRRIIAKAQGKKNWDWKKHPGYGTMYRTRDALQGKF